MPEVGSDAWIEAFAERASRLTLDAATSIVVQQELDDTGERWHVVVGGGRATVAAGDHPAPDVTFNQDRTTAVAVAAGSLSAQQAFMDGRLRVRGTLHRLVDAADVMATLGGRGGQG